MSTEDVQKFEGEWTSGKMHLQGRDLQVSISWKTPRLRQTFLTLSLRQVACEYWLMYLETYDEISEVFDKYDDGHTGFLSKAKFAACMKELNGGVELGLCLLACKHYVCATQSAANRLFPHVYVSDDEDIEEVVNRASVVAAGAVTKPGERSFSDPLDLGVAAPLNHRSHARKPCLPASLGQREETRA